MACCRILIQTTLPEIDLESATRHARRTVVANEQAGVQAIGAQGAPSILAIAADQARPRAARRAVARRATHVRFARPARSAPVFPAADRPSALRALDRARPFHGVALEAPDRVRPAPTR